MLYLEYVFYQELGSALLFGVLQFASPNISQGAGNVPNPTIQKLACVLLNASFGVGVAGKCR